MTAFRLAVDVAFVSLLASAVLICSAFEEGQGVTALPPGVLGRRNIDCQYHAGGKSLPGCPGTAATPSAAAGLGVATHKRQLLQFDFQPTALTEWEQSSQVYAKKYARGSCFDDYPGFIAKDITGVQSHSRLGSARSLGCSRTSKAGLARAVLAHEHNMA